MYPIYWRSRPRKAIRLAPLVAALCLAAGLPPPAANSQEVPSDQDPTPALELPPIPPEANLGFRPGEDRRVADWGQVMAYFEALAAGSRRVRLDTIGRSTLDRPMLLVTISEPGNLDRLDELREIQSRLADPRRITDPEERAALTRDGRLVVLITAAIHPTEVGATLAPLRIAYRLASASDPASLTILKETVILIVPSLNPDGVDSVAEWYRASLGMPWEGEPPPSLYHHYAGHDLNRDWYAFTQTETVNVVENVHNVWHPHVVHDIHQQEPWGPRFFVPPWLDPIEPNVDPLLIAGANALGTSIAWEMQRLGKMSVTVQAGYDAWAPGRAYSHYHGGVRILSETASARLATPIEVHRDELRDRRGWPAGDRTWNQPSPWPGGRWSLSDIVEYMEAGAMALLRAASANREAWLESFLTVGESAVSRWPEWPAAWIIPTVGAEPTALAELSRILHTAEVEIHRADDQITAAGDTYPAGTLVVSMRQPYASFAQAMLSPRPYPGGPAYPGGPPRVPYDATAHNLPLLLGVTAIAVGEMPTGEMTLITEPEAEPDRHIDGLSGEPGVFVGLYQSRVPTADEGWTRWLFDRYEIPYATLHDQDIRQGNLSRRFTSIVLPSLRPEAMEKGWPAGSMPADYTGGLGAAGLAELTAFVEEGGALVALGEASAYLIEGLDLPVVDRLNGQPQETFLSTGAQVRLDVDTMTTIGRGMPAVTSGWLQSSGVFDLEPGGGAISVASYGLRPRVLSGWVHGVGALGGGTAVAELPRGRGRVVLFGIRPQYRGQTLATLPLFFNSLRPRR